MSCPITSSSSMHLFRHQACMTAVSLVQSGVKSDPTWPQGEIPHFWGINHDESDAECKRLCCLLAAVIICHHPCLLLGTRFVLDLHWLWLRWSLLKLMSCCQTSCKPFCSFVLRVFLHLSLAISYILAAFGILHFVLLLCLVGLALERHVHLTHA